jgi:hypothetical protein
MYTADVDPYPGISIIGTTGIEKKEIVKKKIKKDRNEKGN